MNIVAICALYSWALICAIHKLLQVYTLVPFERQCDVQKEAFESI